MGMRALALQTRARQDVVKDEKSRADFAILKEKWRSIQEMSDLKMLKHDLEDGTVFEKREAAIDRKIDEIEKLIEDGPRNNKLVDSSVAEFTAMVQHFNIL